MVQNMGEGLTEEGFYYCFYTFKDKMCRYTGRETTCDKSLKRCQELGNFQMWPLPPKGIYKKLKEDIVRR